MSHPAPAKHENLATIPYRKIKVGIHVTSILCLPGGQRIITRSSRGSFHLWDLETGTLIQVEEWEDTISSIALSPDGKILASGSRDGVVKLWSTNTGKVIRTLMGYTEGVVVWSPDGGRVLGKSADWTFKVWDVKSGEIILGPIEAGLLRKVCYSPGGKMIAAMDTDELKIWDANTGKLLKTLKGYFDCLAWTSNGKTLTALGVGSPHGRGFQIMKFDTATWTVLDLRKNLVDSVINRIFLSPDGRFFAIASYNCTAQLWNVETNQPIGTPLHRERGLDSGTLSADGKLLIANYSGGGHIHI